MFLKTWRWNFRFHEKWDTCWLAAWPLVCQILYSIKVNLPSVLSDTAIGNILFFNLRQTETMPVQCKNDDQSVSPSRVLSYTTNLKNVTSMFPTTLNIAHPRQEIYSTFSPRQPQLGRGRGGIEKVQACSRIFWI